MLFKSFPYGLFFLLFIQSFSAFAQLTPERIKIKLADNLEVELVSILNAENNRAEYYYLPNNIRVSINQQSQPELLFMAWDRESDRMQIIMHWMLTWGLTGDQESEVQRILQKQVDSNAVLMGSVQVQPMVQDVKITGSNESMIQLLVKNLTSGGSIPTSPGGKSAAAFKFSGPDASTILESQKNTAKWKQVFVEMPFQFNIPQAGSGTKVLRLEVKTIFQQLAACKDCIKLI